MRNMEEILDKLVAWTQKNSMIRAVILTSSRANPNAPVDLLSDYDIELVVTDVTPFRGSDAWITQFGGIMTDYREDHESSITRLVLFEDGVRIDFQVYLVAQLQETMRLPLLPEELDIGYRVLLDKDGLTATMKPPQHTGFITDKPSREDYHSRVTAFWWDITYVAKSLWRDELFYAKYMLDSVIRIDMFMPMIEWHIGVNHEWNVNPGKNGRWFKRYLDDRTWSELEETYAGASHEDNWRALFAMTDLFRKLAVELGEKLGYDYPHARDRRVVAYMQRIRQLEPDAQQF
ncbi:aminoglycoside 6-adenylyltransferase [Paenibacillus lignilyticus]|uniref:Aminoglycoside 6-adenylyltransferase n=1 Tax=Paenibacillus lignilyticus TaxID=1172615 RepID=A0ABS5CFY6_9BACL|nr:aminoglycoside 6-adenylyltransferase [Paenibacillus lignilyticus]MBP3964764.1 aminoglycoside 6-adenylyltransferase [Paenibacillus lignilyticus]